MAVNTTMRVLRHMPKRSPATPAAHASRTAPLQPRARAVSVTHGLTTRGGRTAIDCPGAFLYGSRMRHARLVLLVVVLCAACGFFTRKKQLLPSDTLWSDANQAMQDEAWDLAVQKYKALLEGYPFDPNAEQAGFK